MIPLNYKVLIQDEVIEEVTAGGIILDQGSTNRRQAGSVFGHVVSMGPTAFKPKEVVYDKGMARATQDDYAGLAPEIGTRVCYVRNAGRRFIKKEGEFFPIDEDYNDGGELYRVLNDIDITAIMVEKAND